MTHLKRLKEKRFDEHAPMPRCELHTCTFLHLSFSTARRKSAYVSKPLGAMICAHFSVIFARTDSGSPARPRPRARPPSRTFPTPPPRQSLSGCPPAPTSYAARRSSKRARVRAHALESGHARDEVQVALRQLVVLGLRFQKTADAPRDGAQVALHLLERNRPGRAFFAFRLLAAVEPAQEVRPDVPRVRRAREDGVAERLHGDGTALQAHVRG